ncbi:MAG TPA: hypothetical protein VND19_18670 [Acetobacteraceae bacterium]|nr:hypothetical protein [Acetobacteraceae bacterium]
MSGALLPNAYAAMVAAAKVRDYLLDPAHPGNGGKAAFFNAFGFDRLRWTEMRDALLGHPRANQVARVQPTSYGTKYCVRCTLSTPDGRNPCITTVWVIDLPSGAPKFVTAFP